MHICGTHTTAVTSQSRRFMLMQDLLCNMFAAMHCDYSFHNSRINSQYLSKQWNSYE